MPERSYRTVLVGTDAPSSSLRAVDRAAGIAGAAGAQLLIACASRTQNSQDGSPGVQDILRGAVDRARTSGADNLDSIALVGDPVDELADTAKARDVDLVVVGNRGMNSLGGRLLGSVPANLSHRVACDVLIVQTSGDAQ